MSVLIHTEGSVARNPSFRLQNALMQYPRQTNTSLYGLSLIHISEPTRPY